MSDFEKLGHVRRELEEIRNDLSQRILEQAPRKADLVILHDRVCRAIKALSAQG